MTASLQQRALRVRNAPGGARRARGFTLLEMMVVVFLIGLSVTIVTLSLERDVDKVAELEARRFASLVEHVRDESILSGRTYALEVDPISHGYRFLEPGETWTPVKGNDVMRERSMPDYLDFRLELLEGAKDNKLILIQGLSEISPFVFTVVGDDFDYQVTIDGALNLSVERREHEPG